MGTSRHPVNDQALARGLGPAALSGALLYEAQARMFAGELDRAAEQVVQSGRIGASVDAKALWHLDTLSGDLAVLSGRPQGAFEHYARSLEAAQARGDHLQVFHDLEGVADALAILQDDMEALEVVGLAEAQGQDLGTPAAGTAEHLSGSDAVAACQCWRTSLGRSPRQRGVRRLGL